MLGVYLWPHCVVQQKEAAAAAAAAAVVVAASLPLPLLTHSVTKRDDGVHVFSVELDTPIECVCMQTDIRLELVDQPDASVIVSKMTPETGGLLATYRCQGTQVR